MSIDVEIDVGVLKSEIKKTYASVSQEPEKDFIFPTGRAWAEDLGYPEELANVPETAVGSFAGVANPWQLGRLALGERVLDLGSGAGTDSLVAAQMVGEHGHVTGGSPLISPCGCLAILTRSCTAASVSNAHSNVSASLLRRGRSPRQPSNGGRGARMRSPSSGAAWTTKTKRSDPGRAPHLH